jgi:biotin operon repressor
MKGFLRIPNTLRYSSEFTLIEKWLLAVIGSWADGCRVTQSALAEELGVTRQWVNVMIRSLKERGAIEIETAESGQKIMRLTCQFSRQYMSTKLTRGVNSVDKGCQLSGQQPHYINNKDNRKKKENGATAPKPRTLNL